MEAVVKKIGGSIWEETDPDTKQKWHSIFFRDPTVDNLKKLPIIPFAFELSLYRGCVLYGAGGDSALEVLKSQKQLVALKAGGCGVTNAGLKELKGLENLRSLDIGMSRITDAGLKELVGLQNLRALDLTNNNITDAGMKELVKLKNLRTLKLFGTFVTDTGVRELTALKDLRSLDLSRTEVTNAGLRGTRRIQATSRADHFWRREVTGEGLKHLAAIESLTHAQSGLHKSNRRRLEGVKGYQEPPRTRPVWHLGDELRGSRNSPRLERS